MTVIECGNLTKSYRKKVAIDNVTLRLDRDKMIGLIGRNGAGKTTLLKLIAGYHQKTSGELTVFSENPVNNVKVANNLIFVDDQMEFPASLNLYEILQAASKFYPQWDMKLAKRLADYFSLSATRYHNELSKGMRSTFNMIIGIASRCPLTIFDEPTTGMDAGVRQDFYRALLKDYIAHPRTIILSSHLLNEMEDLLEEIVLLKQGSLCLHMTVEELQQYAVALAGGRREIERVVGELVVQDDNTVYRQEFYGENTMKIVVRNTFSEKQYEDFKARGIDVAPVSANDICLYLTDKQKGGIDRVFDRE